MQINRSVNIQVEDIYVLIYMRWAIILGLKIIQDKTNATNKFFFLFAAFVLVPILIHPVPQMMHPTPN